MLTHIRVARGDALVFLLDDRVGRAALYMRGGEPVVVVVGHGMADLECWQVVMGGLAPNFRYVQEQLIEKRTRP